MALQQIPNNKLISSKVEHASLVNISQSVEAELCQDLKELCYGDETLLATSLSRCMLNKEIINDWKRVIESSVGANPTVQESEAIKLMFDSFEPTSLINACTKDEWMSGLRKIGRDILSLDCTNNFAQALHDKIVTPRINYLSETSIENEEFIWRQLVASDGKKEYNGLALTNFGNQCFVISSINALLMPDSMQSLMQHPVGDNYAMQQLQLMFHKKKSNPQSLLRWLGLKKPAFHNDRQQDAAEFILQLLDKSICQPLSELTSFTQGYQINCTSCKNTTNYTHEKQILTLNLKNNQPTSIQDLIDTVVKESEVRKGEVCETCKKKPELDKKKYQLVHKMNIQRPSKVLVLEVTRFTNSSYQANDGEWVERVTKNQAEVYPDDQIEIGHLQYNLKALITHIGSRPDSGHYITYLKVGKNKWRKCNDHSVTNVGRIAINDAYVLVYELYEVGNPSIATPVPNPATARVCRDLFSDDNSAQITPRSRRPPGYLTDYVQDFSKTNKPKAPKDDSSSNANHQNSFQKQKESSDSIIEKLKGETQPKWVKQKKMQKKVREANNIIFNQLVHCTNTNEFEEILSKVDPQVFVDDHKDHLANQILELLVEPYEAKGLQTIIKDDEMEVDSGSMDKDDQMEVVEISKL